MQITFLGGAGTVTGSKYFVEFKNTRLLVDCGLFQGYKALRLRNWSSFPIPPKSLNAVILTHAHLDHSGYLPKLCREGYRGPIFCTASTFDLLKILLPDSGHLQEEEARHANRRGHSKHHPALPLYTQDEAIACLDQVVPLEFYQSFSPAPNLEVRFSRAGHILGSACVRLKIRDTTLVFSGDVGRTEDPIMNPPEALTQTDYLVLESTYGDKRHPPENVPEVLSTLINETVKKNGTVVVPAFAVGRAQHLLHELAQLRRQGKIPNIPIYLDSPMAIEATEIFCNNTSDHRLSVAQCQALSQVAHYSRSREESQAIGAHTGPKIILSASGMATGGRILFHLHQFLPDEKNAVLLVGFQAAGTRGRSLLDGADEIKMLGEYVPVRAKIQELKGLSAHADYSEIIHWLKRSNLSPRKVFITHGEPAASDALRRRLKDTFNWETVVPGDGETWKL